MQFLQIKTYNHQENHLDITKLIVYTLNLTVVQYHLQVSKSDNCLDSNMVTTIIIITFLNVQEIETHNTNNNLILSTDIILLWILKEDKKEISELNKQIQLKTIPTSKITQTIILMEILITLFKKAKSHNKVLRGQSINMLHIHNEIEKSFQILRTSNHIKTELKKEEELTNMLVHIPLI